MFNLDQRSLPIRLYHTANLVMLAMPMPGLEPQDISIKIAGERVFIHGEPRGPDGDWRELLVDAWRVGPYDREVNLPIRVSGLLTNATYGNGVLVLAMPKLAQEEPDDVFEFVLEAISPTHGERVGHTGIAIRATTTRAHRELEQRTGRTAQA